jgi:ABC-type polysaccharide/polyol phosphate export permease
MTHQIAELFRYRALIQSLISRELKARYRGSVLGFVWSFVNPLLLLLTYGFVFSVVFPMGKYGKALQPYFLFLFCGILPWTWFQASLAESASVLLTSGTLIKKVLFPAEVLPVVSVLANLVHFLLGLPVLLVLLVYDGKLTWWALLLPLPLLVQLVFTLGLALFFSALTVHFRDLRDLLNHIVHLWFWATPILYFYPYQDARFRLALKFNPLTHIFVTYHDLLFRGCLEHLRGLAGSAVVALLTLAVGLFVFDRLRDTLAEEV